MPNDTSIAYARFQELLDTLINSLPGYAIGLTVFILFFFLSRAINRLVRRKGSPRRHRNLSRRWAVSRSGACCCSACSSA